jgi:hypothetical protein
MDDLIRVALAKEFKEIRITTPGVHEIDETVTLHIKGTVTRNKDYMRAPTVSIPLKATLALALQKAGFQREHIKRILIESMQEALALGEQAEGIILERLADVDEAMTHVADAIKNLGKVPTAGGTKVDVTITEVAPEPAEVLTEG